MCCDIPAVAVRSPPVDAAAVQPEHCQPWGAVRADAEGSDCVCSIACLLVYGFAASAIRGVLHASTLHADGASVCDPSCGNAHDQSTLQFNQSRTSPIAAPHPPCKSLIEDVIKPSPSCRHFSRRAPSPPNPPFRPHSHALANTMVFSPGSPALARPRWLATRARTARSQRRYIPARAARPPDAAGENEAWRQQTRRATSLRNSMKLLHASRSAGSASPSAKSQVTVSGRTFACCAFQK